MILIQRLRSFRELNLFSHLCCVCLLFCISLPMLFLVMPVQAQAAPQTSLTAEQRAELDALFQQGFDAYEKGGIQDSLTILQKGLKRAQELRSPVHIGLFLAGMGRIYGELGQSKKALEFHLQTLELQLKNQAGARDIASTLYLLGTDYHELGQNDKALDYLSLTVELQRKSHAGPLEVAFTLNNLGSFYHDFGQNDKALDYLHQALELFVKNNGNPMEVALILNNLGGICFSLGMKDRAMDYYILSLELKRKNNANSLEIARAYLSLGSVYAQYGQNDKALEIYNQAFVLLVEKDDVSPEEFAVLYSNLGNLHRVLGHNEQALHFLHMALELRRKNNSDAFAIAASLADVGEILRRMGQFKEAEQSFAEAVNLRETASLQVSDPAQVGVLQETFGHFYERYARLLTELNRPESALEMLERGQGQGLARQLDLNRRGNITREFTPEERKRLDALTEVAHMALADQRRMKQQMENATAEQRTVLNERKQKAERAVQQSQQDYRLFLDALFARYPHLRSVAPGQSAPFSELRLMAHKNSDSLYLEYSIVDDHTILLFALGEKDGLKVLSLNADYQEVSTAIQKWREALQVSGGRRARIVNRSIRQQAVSEEKKLAHQLYSLLLGEVEKKGLLAAGRYKRLVIVGSGTLLEMPLTVLLDEAGKRLIARYAVTRMLALSIALWHDTPSHPHSSLLCIADPTGGQEVEEKSVAQKLASSASASPRAMPSAFRADFLPLPGARQEGHAVAELFAGSKLLVGPKAKESQVLKLLPDYKILHFATHGFLVPHAVLNSGLVLAEEPLDSPDDGILSAQKILNLPLSAKLAVLSACETGRGQLQGGEGLMGLVWAFRAAGIPAVVASQWQVDDAATKQLMVTFYKELKVGKRKDDAMRTAMLAVQKEHPSPYYWAAFELIGDTTPLLH